jgi:hypothetical protein
MVSTLALALLAVTPLAPLPDVPAPLGRLDGVLVEKDTAPKLNEKIVSAQLKGCDHPVPLHVTRFVSGVMFALQQLLEWMAKTPGLEAQLYQRKGVLGEVLAGLGRSLPGEVHACKPMAKDAAAAPKLCPGAGADEAWLLDGKRPAAQARWEASSKECLPRITGVLFDDRSAVRVRYEADFAGEVKVTLMGDRCQNVVFSFDSQTQVFHAERRGCKGP